MTEIPTFALRQIHQIEITSRCNLRCVYCVHRHMPREKADMSMDVFLKAVSWAKTFADRGWQRSLNLAGIGESTMHPLFTEFVGIARARLGPSFDLVLATNGLLVDDEMAEKLAPYRPRVFVSLHRPEKAGPAVEVLKRAGILAGVSTDPSTAATDWAGQVKWHRSAVEYRPCGWVRHGAVFVMSDGRLSPCSFDGTGDETIGSVFDDLDQLATHPYRLCVTCDQRLEIDGWDQQSGRRKEEAVGARAIRSLPLA
jgi:hypothetical protein